MPTISEGQLKFEFPDEWRATKFDEWSFYRNRFIKVADACLNCSKCESAIRCAVCDSSKVAGTKAIDILAIDPDSNCWQIEVKDYRQTRETSFVFLADEVTLKVRDTLACLMAAGINSNDVEEIQLAKAAQRCNRMRIVLHLQQPVPKSRLVSSATRRANVLQRLKQLAKAIDPRPLVLDMNEKNGVGWTVTQVGSPPG